MVVLVAEGRETQGKVERPDQGKICGWRKLPKIKRMEEIFRLSHELPAFLMVICNISLYFVHRTQNPCELIVPLIKSDKNTVHRKFYL